ncbi:MAG: hypothetical protein JNM22_18615 [Saprospiraceae bacterium]|nr:hypothetical protein [Saprospiraceae bacterium]
MNWQDFEEQLKKQVEGHETPIDTEGLWARVQPRKRRRFLLFFWWLLGAAGLFGGAYWVAGHRQHPATVFSLQEETQSAIQTNAFNTVPQAGLSTDTTSASTTPKTTTPKNAGAIRTSQHNDRPARNQTAHNRQMPSGRAVEGLPLSTTKTASSPGNEAPALLLPDPALASDLALLPTYLHFLPPPAGEKLILPEIFVTPPAPLFVVPAQPQDQVGIQSGISYWNVLHPSGPDAVFPRTNERLLEAFHAGAFFQKQVGRRLAIRAGLQYQRYNAVFRWQTSSILGNQPRQVLNYYSDGRIDTTFIPGGTLVEATRTVRHYNRVSSWMLPIDLKWRIPAGRTTLMPFLGVQAGFQSQSGALLNANGQPDFSRYNSIYKTLFNFGLRSGVSSEWRINERHRLLIEPWGAVDLRSRTGRFNPAYEQFWQVGLSVGVVRMMNDE